MNPRFFESQATNEESVLIFVIITQGDQQFIYERQSGGLLDLLGDIGGVMEAFTIFTLIIGEFFSKRFFR